MKSYVDIEGSGLGAGNANDGLCAAGGSPWIEEATIRVQGGDLVYGSVSRGTPSRLTVKRILIEVTGSSIESDGILPTLSAYEAEIRDVQITAASSGTSYGIRLIDSSGSGGLRLTDSTINAEDYGIGSLRDGPIFIENSQVCATASNGYGVEALYTSVTVDHSEIAGGPAPSTHSPPRIGATRLHGGAVVAVIMTVCAMVDDESFVPTVGPACP